MATARKPPKADPFRDAAVEYFAARSHNAWRRRLLQTDPAQKGKPRMRLRGGVMVDANQPWAKLHPKAKADNMRAAHDAYAAVKRFPDDREAAADFVHKRWIVRNARDPSQPKALFKSYSNLPEVEKDKDRAHVDAMKRALAAVGAVNAKRKTVRKPAKTKTVRLDAKTWRRLEAAAKALSAALGRDVSVEALLVAGAEAIAAVSKDAKPATRPKRA